MPRSVGRPSTGCDQICFPVAASRATMEFSLPSRYITPSTTSGLKPNLPLDPGTTHGKSASAPARRIPSRRDIRLFLGQLRAGRGIGVEVAEHVLHGRQYMLRPHGICVERGGVAERREVGAALPVGFDPGQSVILIGPRAFGAETSGGGHIRPLDIEAEQYV